jgi:selenide,water dikinase
LNLKEDPSLIVGFRGADDAAIYRLSDEMALVLTVDFITPIVDDAYAFGQVAAANSLSDVYAMGGKPLVALNIVCFPTKSLEVKELTRILEGARDKLEEAGVVMAGGHSIQDEELKFGLSVTGSVDPGKVIRNSTSKPGDKLILTKPLGTGVQATALKAKLLELKEEEELVLQMTTLNKQASEIMREFGAHAATDVSGFGLIGHSCEMADGSGYALSIESQKVPYITGVDRLVSLGLIPAAMYANRDFRLDMVEVNAEVPDWMINVLFDPQTSGGLLIAVAGESAAPMLEAMHKAGYERAAVIGEVVARPRHEVRVSVR